MSHNFTTTIITERWNEAVANPDIARWRSLAYWAGEIADSMEQEEPDSIMVPSLRAVSEAAYGRMIAMQPKEVAA